MLKKNLLKEKKSNVTLYITFFIVSIIILVIGGLFAPIGVLMNIEFLSTGERIMLQANNSIATINDAEIRESIYAVLEGSFDAAENNIAVNNALYQYIWIPMLLLTFIIIFLASRQLVETSGGFV